MRGIGYVEFLSCQKEINDLLNMGYTISSIHKKLYEEKKIIIGVKRFYAILHKKGMKKVSLQQLKIPREMFNESVSNEYNQRNLTHNNHILSLAYQDESSLSSEQDKPLFDLKKYGDNERL